MCIRDRLWEVPLEVRAKLPGVLCALAVEFAISGRAHAVVAPIGALCAWAGRPLSTLAQSALGLLLSHALWAALAMRTLSYHLRPFWPRDGGRWLRASWQSLWLYWAVGGYAASLAAYCVADEIALWAQAFAATSDGGAQLGAVARLLPARASGHVEHTSLVTRLTCREEGGAYAVALGALAPCLSAPIFEEVLYRAFLLTALSAYLPVRLAVPLQGLVFGVHHLQPHAVLQLTALGSLWGVLYLRSRNLLVCVLVHLLWNSRAFICALGLLSP